MADTELPSGSRNMFCRFAKRLVANILIVVKIVPGDNDFIAVVIR
jgi:hypothetical protein